MDILIRLNILHHEHKQIIDDENLFITQSIYFFCSYNFKQQSDL